MTMQTDLIGFRQDDPPAKVRRARRVPANDTTIPPWVFSSLRCCRCGEAIGREGSIIALGENVAGPFEIAWDSLACARLDGWPTYLSERRARKA